MWQTSLAQEERTSAGAAESPDGPSELMTVAIVQQVQFYLSTDNLRRPDTFLLDIMVQISVKFRSLGFIIHMQPRWFARVGKAWWRSPIRGSRQLPQNHSAHHQARLDSARLAPRYAHKVCAPHTPCSHMPALPNSASGRAGRMRNTRPSRARIH